MEKHNTAHAIFAPEAKEAEIKDDVWQHDFGQTLQIEGLSLPPTIEVHYANKGRDTAIPQVGVTKDGITTAPIPNEILNEKGAFTAYIFVTDGKSGETCYTITGYINKRPALKAFDTPEDQEIFHAAVDAVNKAAERAESAEAKATEAASQTAKDAKQTAADRAETERLVESVSGIGEQVTEVENLTKQAQTSATNAALSEQAAKTAETNAQTAQAGAEAAEGNAELAERNVKVSEQAVEKAKQLVTQMGQEVLNNKNHVDQTVQAFDQTAQQAVADVNSAGQIQTERVQSAGNTAVESVKTEQGKATQAIETAKTEAVKAVQTEGTTQTGNVTAEGAKQVQAVQAAAQEIVADREQIKTNKADIALLKDIAVVENASGKTIIVEDASDFPVKSMQGAGKIIITGKNILKTEEKNKFVPLEAKAGTVFTLLTNKQPSKGGNIKFVAEDDSTVWFAMDKGQTKVTNSIQKNVKGFYNLLSEAEGLKYCFSVGENDKYEEYVEQVITAPVSAEQLKTIHTNYPITVLTSENEITVEYVADTEAYIGKRIKEENQSLQKQILEIQNALISQKISGGYNPS